MLADFRRMRSDMQAAGMFDSSALYYAMKARVCCGMTCSRGERATFQAASNLAICFLSLALLSMNDSYAAVFGAAFLMVRFIIRRVHAAVLPLTFTRRRCSGSSVAGLPMTFSIIRSSSGALTITRLVCFLATCARCVSRA